ncbi:MAG: hypothetical protein HQ557_12975 [Bacteroidetes bacterium]|nr:hypothetical protein [Bacteroidota bacterium]
MNKGGVSLVVIFFLCFFLLSGCRTSGISQNPNLTIENGKMQPARIETVTGKVEILPDGRPALIAKWESKSRISYTIIGDMSKQVYQRDGEILTVDCIVIAMDSPWQGKMVIISVHP